MKQRIFKGQYGYFIVAKNYKDKEDKQYVNIHFIDNEPNLGGDYVDIELKDAWLTCYKGKVGLTVKDYEIIKNYVKDLSKEEKQVEKANEDWTSSIQGTKAAELFGSKLKVVDIEPDDLPFY